MSREKEIIIVIVVLVAILAVVFYFFGGYFDGKVGDGEYEPVSINMESGDSEDLSADEVQANFPSDFPFEEGVGITNNYKYNLRNTDNDQYTIEYESGRSVAQNFSIFRDYLIDRGYKITNSMNEETRAFLYGDGPTGDISILINTDKDKVIISASFLKQ